MLEYVELANKAAHLKNEMHAACLSSEKWWEAITPGALAWLTPTPGAAPELSFVIGTTLEMKLLFEEEVRHQLVARTASSASVLDTEGLNSD